MTSPLKTLTGFLCLGALIGTVGCSAPSAVELMVEDSISLDQLAASGTPTLSATQIVDLAQANGKLKEKSNSLPLFSFVREVKISKPGDNNSTKTYQAFTNNRDQTLIKINGRKPTSKEIEEEQKKNHKRQRKYLQRDNKEGSEKVMSNNMDLYREKFIPRLIGTETVGSRPAYLIQLLPDTNHRIKNNTVDRIMNQMLTKLWVDQEDFQVSRIEAELVRPISIAIGLVGSINNIHIRLKQKRLTPQMWTDLRIDAEFDVRILTANYTFTLKSSSSGFNRVSSGLHKTQ